MAKYRAVRPGSYGLKEETHYLYYASPLACVAATSPQAQDTSLYDIATHYGTVVPLDQVLHRLRGLEPARTA